MIVLISNLSCGILRKSYPNLTCRIHYFCQKRRYKRKQKSGWIHLIIEIHYKILLETKTKYHHFCFELKEFCNDSTLDLQSALFHSGEGEDLERQHIKDKFGIISQPSKNDRRDNIFNLKSISWDISVLKCTYSPYRFKMEQNLH